MHRRVLAAVALATISLASAPARAASVTPVRFFDRTLAPTGSLDANYLAGGADVNGDGHPDILLGSENGTFGRVSLFSGTNGLITSIDGRATATFLGSGRGVRRRPRRRRRVGVR